MKKFILVLSLFFVTTYTFALQPPREGEIASLRRSGDLAERLNFALRLGNHKFSPELVDRANQRLQTGNNNLPAPPNGWKGMPTKGNIRTFALLIAFQDYPPLESSQSIHNKLFGNGNSSDYPYESLANYYDRSSYNQLNLHNGITCDWYIAPYLKSSVPQTIEGRENLIKEALNHCKQQGNNFSQFDNDGDGDIDYFMVIWSGPYGEWASFWWAYQPLWVDNYYAIDGKKLSAYSWQMHSSNSSTPNVFDAATVIHETGHALGLPDFYDYNNDIGPKGGVGWLDMMAGSKCDHNAFSKWMLEWITPTFVASGTQNLSLKALGNNPDAVVIMPNVNKDKLFSEYFIVENRYRVGNDQSSYIYFPPNDGLLVWHVDARLDEWSTSFLFNNSISDHKLLRLMEADGLEEIEKGNSANAGDYYTKGKFFTDNSFPNSKKYNGTSSGVSVTNISDVGNTMSATFSISGVTTTKTNYFIVFNDGNADLVVSSITPETSAPWLTINPSSFVVIPNSSQSVAVTVDYSLVPQGSSTTKLRVSSNDPDENPYPNGVTINVASSNQTPTPSETLPTSASFCVPVVVEQDLYVHIPDLTYNGVHLWANLRFIQEQGKLLFEVVGFGMNYPTCASATLASDFKLHIPTATFGGNKYWLDFQLYPTSNGKFIFELMNYGQLP